MPVTNATDIESRSPKWLARREAIIDTSASIFAGQGYHATGMSELCAANGLGKGAFYHYIGSKEELLAAIHDRVMDEVLASKKRVAGADASATEKLTMLGDELLTIISHYPDHVWVFLHEFPALTIISHYPDHVWVFLHEFPALTGERATRFRRRRREYERYIEQVLQAGIDAGEFRDIDVKVTAMAWLGMHNYTYLWLKPKGPLTAQDVAGPFADIFLGGITRPRRGAR